MKVLPNDATLTEETPVVERTPRTPYMEVATNLTEDGKLAGVPTDFDGTKHLKPKTDDFANAADAYDFKALQFEVKAAQLLESAKKSRDEAETIRKFGDPAKRAMAKRANKLRDQLAALEAQLAEEGIEA